MPTDSSTNLIFVDAHLSKSTLVVSGEVSRATMDLIEELRHVVCFSNEAPGEVIFESKIDHPPVPDVAVELKGLEIQRLNRCHEDALFLFTDSFFLVPKTPRYGRFLLKLRKQRALTARRILLAIRVCRVATVASLQLCAQPVSVITHALRSLSFQHLYQLCFVQNVDPKSLGFAQL